MPGWSRRELAESLKLVREFMMPDWDIHPEMVTHTFVIDTKTGRPYPERSERFMENWRWTDNRSVDEIADYMSYALRILKNAGLACEGITTPGGFGNRVLPELAQATLAACRDVFDAEIPHYFRHLFTDERSVAPRVEYASGLAGPDPRCVVSIIGCTGDWFGGWDGLTPGSADRCITEDLRGGRLPEVIERGEPAILVCHWPGIYFNGEQIGFKIFQEVVRRVHSRYDNLIWMKLSEIARYWAARELTQIRRQGRPDPGRGDRRDNPEARAGREYAMAQEQHLVSGRRQCDRMFRSAQRAIHRYDLNWPGGEGGALAGCRGGGVRMARLDFSPPASSRRRSGMVQEEMCNAKT